MANKVDVELVTVALSESESTIWGEWAVVFTDALGNRRGIPWAKISQRQFSMANALAVAVIDGYVDCNPALYCGMNDDNNAVYCIFKQAD